MKEESRKKVKEGGERKKENRELKERGRNIDTYIDKDR